MKLLHTWHKIGNRPYNLHLTEEGSGPILIFLHGIGSTSGNWHALIPLLKHNFTCITIDLLGFGDSPKPQWSKYRIEDHLKSIRYTIKKLGINEPYTLIGHSLGSLLACRYASKNKQNMRRLVMISPPVYLHPTHQGRTSTRSATNHYLKAYKFLRTHKKFTLKNAARISKLLPGPGILHINEQSWIPFTRTLEQCIENQTVITDITKVSAPTEVIYGSRDQFVLQQNMKVLSTMSHVHVAEVKGAGHTIRPSFAKAIAQVLSRTD